MNPAFKASRLKSDSPFSSSAGDTSECSTASSTAGLVEARVSKMDSVECAPESWSEKYFHLDPSGTKQEEENPGNFPP